MSPLLKLVLGAIAYRSLTRGQGKLAALIAARMGGFLKGGVGGAFIGAVMNHMFEALRRYDQPAAPEDVLGEDAIRWLMAKTGMTRAELLAGLRRYDRDDTGT